MEFRFWCNRRCLEALWYLDTPHSPRQPVAGATWLIVRRRVVLGAMIQILNTRIVRLLIGLLLIVGLAACSGPESSENTEVRTETASGDASLSSPQTTGGAADAGTQQSSVAVETAGSTVETPAGEDTEAPTQMPGGETATTDANGAGASATTDPANPSLTPTTQANPTGQINVSGGILPGNRVISYYGHPNSSAMGILGEYSKEEVLQRLQQQGAEYAAADPNTPVVLAFELIATVAQPVPGSDGTYVAYTGDEIIGEYAQFTADNNMLLILDLQIGLDTIPNQINLIRKWLELPNVHVALDPEFSMKANETVPRDRIPGEFIGEVNGHDVNVAIQMLDQLVQEKGLPPKMLIVHQFETEMIYNKEVITSLPGVDFVLDMDGFGGPEAKTGNYGHFVRDQLIEYGGIKLFYKQDDPVMTPAEIVALDPPPLVIIYQ